MFLYLGGIDDLTVSNTGTITGGLGINLTFDPALAAVPIAITNSGTISSSSNAATIDLSQYYYSLAVPVTVTLTNGGTVANHGSGAALNVGLLAPVGVTVDNSGTIVGALDLGPGNDIVDNDWDDQREHRAR